jgi:3-oxoacyl-(acyl-carrier-protein) synthase
MKKVLVSGIGCITPHFDSVIGMAAHCQKPVSPRKKEIEKISLPADIKLQDQRRMAKISRIALFAATQAYACANAAGMDAALFVGLTHGTTSLLKEFHDYLVDYGPELASPNAFSNGVTGAALGVASKYLNCTLGGTTLVGYETTGLDALNAAANAVLAGDYPRCLAGAAEEFSSHVEQVYRGFGWYSGNAPEFLPNTDGSHGFAMAEAGLFFMIERPGDRPMPGPACVYEPLDSATALPGDIDLIISGAGGGPQDVHELGILESVLAKTGKRPVVFTKPFFGETFAVAPLLSVALAGDILRNGASYPVFPACKALAGKALFSYDPASISRVLILAAARTGDVSAGVLSKTVT